MKRITVLIAAMLFAYSLSGQNSFRYPVTIGMGAPGTVTGGSLILKGLTSGTATIRVPAVAGTGTIFQLPANNGTSGYLLSTDGSGVTSWIEAPATGYTNLTSFVAQTNWRLFYSNGSGDVTELALGANQTYLMSNGATSAPTFEAVTATGYTPAGGSLTLSGADPITLTTSASTSVTLPISGLLVNKQSERATIDSLLAAGVAAMPLITDTIQVATRTYTPTTASTSGMWHSFTETFCAISLPSNATQAIPIGTTLNFVNYAGLLKFVAGSGAVMKAEIDSTATGAAWGVASARKIATNKWHIFGSLKD